MRQKYFLKQNSGFTIIELLVALSISVIVIMFSSMIFIQAIKHTRMITGEAKLVSAATHMTNILALHIRPAISVNSSISSQIEILNPDLTTSILEYASGELRFNGTRILQPLVTPTRFDFFVINNTIQISYELTTDIGSIDGYEINSLVATTTIAIRN